MKGGRGGGGGGGGGLAVVALRLTSGGRRSERGRSSHCSPARPPRTHTCPPAEDRWRDAGWRGGLRAKRVRVHALASKQGPRTTRRVASRGRRRRVQVCMVVRSTCMSPTSLSCLASSTTAPTMTRSVLCTDVACSVQASECSVPLSAGTCTYACTHVHTPTLSPPWWAVVPLLSMHACMYACMHRRLGRHARARLTMCAFEHVRARRMCAVDHVRVRCPWRRGVQAACAHRRLAHKAPFPRGPHATRQAGL